MAAAFWGLAVALSLTILVANRQGAGAPVSSLLSMLPIDSADPQLMRHLAAVRSQLDTGKPSAPAQLLLGDFRTYHEAMAALSAAVCLLLLRASFKSAVRRRSRIPPPARRLINIQTLAPGALGVAYAIVCLANISTSLNPEPGLLAFLSLGA